ncbi:MAG: hypothetical protein ABL959_00810 [Pyrinomonadaceae bacterium]
MTHEEFVERMKAALQHESEGEIDVAVLTIRALLNDIIPAVEKSVNDWHHQQTLGFLVNTLSTTERREECQAAWDDLIAFNQGQLKYWETDLTASEKQLMDWKDSNPTKD